MPGHTSTILLPRRGPFMRTWPEAFSHGVISGSVASLVSTMALAWCGRRQDHSAAAPTNATSHWVWGDGATRVDRPTLRHTVTGYLIHHAASVFWATLYEKWMVDPTGRRHWGAVLADASTLAALACLVDLRMTPRRLTPGFERRLSAGALLTVYAAFAAGLAAATLSGAGTTRAVSTSAPRPSRRPATGRRNGRAPAADLRP